MTDHELDAEIGPDSPPADTGTTEYDGQPGEEKEAAAAATDAADESDHRHLKAVAEALIFASREPLSERQFAVALGRHWKGSLSELVRELNIDYEREGRAFEILAVAGGYQYFTRRDFSGFLRRLNAEHARTRLSRAALETLAVAAYRGPVTRAEIDEIRGVDSGGVLRTLLDRHLIAVKGRAQMLGRPLLYETTPAFLKHFGLSDLSDLPRESELLREWGLPRPAEEPMVGPTSEDPSAIESNVSQESENGRLVNQPTEESLSEKDVL